MKFTFTSPRFSPFSNIPSMLQTHLHLHVFLTSSTNGRSLGPFRKSKFCLFFFLMSLLNRVSYLTCTTHVNLTGSHIVRAIFNQSIINYLISLVLHMYYTSWDPISYTQYLYLGHVLQVDLKMAVSTVEICRQALTKI
jgi:hypothetical protein